MLRIESRENLIIGVFKADYFSVFLSQKIEWKAKLINGIFCKLTHEGGMKANYNILFGNACFN